MSARFANAVIKYRIPVIVVFVAVTAVFASRIPDAKIDSEIKSMLPDDMPARMNIDRIEEIFGGTDMVMLVVSADDVLAPDTLRRIRKLSRGMERVKTIDRVLSLFTLKDIRSEDGQLLVDPAVDQIPGDAGELARLRAALKDNELVYGNVVSEDFTATALIGLLNAEAPDFQTIQDLEKLIQEVPGPEQVNIAGMPYIRLQVGEDIQNDMKRFLPIGLAIMLAFLFLCFKQIRGVLLPFLVVIMSILFSLGLLVTLGWKIQMVTTLLPVILIAVANDYGIHILARYQEENTPGTEVGSHELARSVVRALFSPVVLTGVTTIAGLMCLLTHIVVPSKQLGILASAGVAFALLGSLTFIPAVLAVLPRAKPVMGVERKNGKPGLIERLLQEMARRVVARPRILVVAALVVVAGVATGISVLVVDTDPVHYYPEDAPVARSAALVDQHFGGSGAISIVAHGNVKDPKLLRELDDLEKKLAELPEVGQTSSVAKVVRRMNRVLNPEDQQPDRIPDTPEAVAQYFLLYSMSGEPEDFERLVDFDYQNALLTARINTTSTDAIARVTDFIEEDLHKRPEGMFPVVGGFTDVLSNLVEAIVNGQIISLLLSLVLVSILVMTLFGSVVAGLIAIVPLGMAMALLFGLMGFLKIELNVATAMLSSIMIGVGVDYTIHYLWRYRVERRSGREPVEAVRITLTTTGRGIIFNALSVIVGFSVVLVSNFMPVKFFGFLVVVSIGACLIGALGLLPALCLIFRPRFLEPLGGSGTSETQNNGG